MAVDYGDASGIQDSGGSGAAQTTGSVTVSGGTADGMVLDFVKTGFVVTVFVRAYSATGSDSPLTANFTYPTGMAPRESGLNGQFFSGSVTINSGGETCRLRIDSDGIEIGANHSMGNFNLNDSITWPNQSFTYISSDYA